MISAHTTLVPIRVSEALVDSFIGRRIYCERFEIQPCGDGTYDLIVTQGRGDGALTDLDWDHDGGDANGDAGVRNP